MADTVPTLHSPHGTAIVPQLRKGTSAPKKPSVLGIGLLRNEKAAQK
jgi:hypothetical protein